DEAHAVDARGAAEQLAARLVELPVVERRLGLAGVAPVEARVPEDIVVGRRHADLPGVAGRPGLEHQHADRGGLGGARGADAAGGAAADDDVVELGQESGPPFYPRRTTPASPGQLSATAESLWKRMPWIERGSWHWMIRPLASAMR